MSPISVIQARVEELQHSFSTLARLTSSRPDDWRRRHIGIRREANATLPHIAAAIADCPAAEPEVRPIFTRLRHGITLHQAEWPVVAIDLDDPSYKTSVRDLAATLQQLAVAVRMLGAARSAA